MTVTPGLSLPLYAVGKRIKGWDESGDFLEVEVNGAVRRAACPSCLHRSSQVHGRCQRQLAALPSFGQRVTLSTDVRRFECVNRTVTGKPSPRNSTVWPHRAYAAGND